VTNMHVAIRRLRSAPQKPLAALALAACALCAAAAPGRGDPILTAEQHFQLALEAQSHREYPAMLAHSKVAANLGDVQAQEFLGSVLLAGPSIYGRAVRSDRCEALRWFLAATRAGSEVGRANVDFLNRARNAPQGRRVCDGP